MGEQSPGVSSTSPSLGGEVDGTPPRCAWDRCGKPIEVKATGRPPLYHHDNCRKAAHRAGKSASRAPTVSLADWYSETGQDVPAAPVSSEHTEALARRERQRKVEDFERKLKAAALGVPVVTPNPARQELRARLGLGAPMDACEIPPHTIEERPRRRRTGLRPPEPVALFWEQFDVWHKGQRWVAVGRPEPVWEPDLDGPPLAWTVLLQERRSWLAATGGAAAQLLVVWSHRAPRCRWGITAGFVGRDLLLGGPEVVAALHHKEPAI